MRAGSAGAEKGSLLPISRFVSRQRFLCHDRVLQMLCHDMAFRVATWSSGQVHDRLPARAIEGSGLFLSTVHGHCSQMFSKKTKNPLDLGRHICRKSRVEY